MTLDRTLFITATPTLVWYPNGGIGATITYKQTGSIPDMPNVVDRQTGNIDLSKMPQNDRYTDNIDILISLDSSGVTDQPNNNNPLVVRWAHIDEGTPPSKGCCWFCATPAPNQPKNSTPIEINGMLTERISDTLVIIDDNTADGSEIYTFCLAIVIPAYYDYYITIDPIIKGKGVGTR